MVAYAALSLAPVASYLSLSAAVEAPDISRLPRVSSQSRGTLWKLSSLFAIDSLAGGFLTTALLSFFFYGASASAWRRLGRSSSPPACSMPPLTLAPPG